jgi:acetyl esterase/lipase
MAHVSATGAMDSRKPPRWFRWARNALIVLLAIVFVAVVGFMFLTRNPTTGAFYKPPTPVPAVPGTIIRSEPFTGTLPAGATAWRVLYASTDEHGTPVAVSGLIVAPTNPTPGPHPMLAWSHGTTGIVPACGPSVSADPFKGIPDMTGALTQGWVLAMTDYPGLGTPGPHPYLVGESEARAVADSVRAAHNLDTGVQLDDSYAVWGHSQGGHSALFMGQIAAQYLPEYQLMGVAALAPATLLADNFSAIEGTDVGNVLTIFAVESWADYYDDVSASVLAPDARRPANLIADACLNQPSRLRLVVGGLQLPAEVTSVDISTEPAVLAHMNANSPNPTGITVPLFVAQGLADEVISPHVTDSWINLRCIAGAQVDYRMYPGLTHNGVVEPGGADALAWTIDRFGGKPAATTCPELTL